MCFFCHVYLKDHANHSINHSEPTVTTFSKCPQEFWSASPGLVKPGDHVTVWCFVFFLFSFNYRFNHFEKRCDLSQSLVWFHPVSFPWEKVCVFFSTEGPESPGHEICTSRVLCPLVWTLHLGVWNHGWFIGKSPCRFDGIWCVKTSQSEAKSWHLNSPLRQICSKHPVSMRPWDPLFDFVFVDCLAQVAACEIHHQSWCWSVFVFFLVLHSVDVLNVFLPFIKVI